jgi:hypothetical protein
MPPPPPADRHTQRAENHGERVRFRHAPRTHGHRERIFQSAARDKAARTTIRHAEQFVLHENVARVRLPERRAGSDQDSKDCVQAGDPGSSTPNEGPPEKLMKSL